MLSKANKEMIRAHEKGYRIINGEITNHYGDLVKGRCNKEGYRSFSIIGCGPKIMVHRLVAYQKYGDKLFEDGIEVRHLDGDKSNNTDENITIGTHQQNMMDKSPEQRSIDAGNQSRKHPHQEIIEYHQIHKSYKKTMQKFGIKSKGTLNFILKKSMAKGEL